MLYYTRVQERGVLMLCTYLAQFGSCLQVALNAGKCLHIVLKVGALQSATATLHLDFRSFGTLIIGGIHHVVVVRNVARAANVACIEDVIVDRAEGLEAKGRRVHDR